MTRVIVNAETIMLYDETRASLAALAAAVSEDSPGFTDIHILGYDVQDDPETPIRLKVRWRAVWEMP
jgi:hypothetical protein